MEGGPGSGEHRRHADLVRDLRACPVRGAGAWVAMRSKSSKVVERATRWESTDADERITLAEGTSIAE